MADGSTFLIEASDDNVIEILGERTGSLDIRGKRNRVFIGEGAKFNGQIEIVGDDNLVEIGAWAVVNASCLRITTSGGEILIGRAAAVVASSLQVPEPSRIVIGDESGVGAESWMTTSDMHPVYSLLTGLRINPARDIRLGKGVGGGFRCIYLKGSVIGDGAIIGAGSVVRGRIPANSLASGNPVKVQRSGIRWAWNF
ncbi:acyltransferase [soil metagenome]